MIFVPKLTYYLEKSNNNIPKALELLKQDGFNAVSIFVEDSHDWLRKNWVDVGITPIMHSNFIDINLASSNQGIRKECVRQLKEEVLLAKDIGCKIITFHAGKFQNIHQKEDAQNKFFESMQEVIPFAVQNNVALSVEYLEKDINFLCSSLEGARFVLEKFPLLALTLDAAHAVMNEEDPIKIYDELKKKIKVIHISGFLPEKSHVEVSLVESEYDFTDFIKKIKDFEGFVEIENREYSKFNDSLNFIKKILGE